MIVCLLLDLDWFGIDGCSFMWFGLFTVCWFMVVVDDALFVSIGVSGLAFSLFVV